MGDIGSDTESELRMMREAYIEVQRLHPDHELLHYARLHDDTRGFDFTREYREKFVKESDRWNVRGYARYNLALRESLPWDHRLRIFEHSFRS